MVVLGLARRPDHIVDHIYSLDINPASMARLELYHDSVGRLVVYKPQGWWFDSYYLLLLLIYTVPFQKQIHSLFRS